MSGFDRFCLVRLLVVWACARGLPPGSKLPTEEELQQTYGVSLPTVRDATEVLESAGLVERRPGRGGGVFVRRRVLIEAYASRDDQPMSTISEADLFFAP